MAGTALKNWQVGWSDSLDQTPKEWVAATVPGAVQLDWARAQEWPSYSWNCEVLRYARLEDHHWHYRTTIPELPAGWVHRLVLESVDHRAVVRIQGEMHAAGGGVGSRLEVVLQPEQAGRELAVVVLPAPKVPGSGRAQARETTKAAVAYGWDFHPELVPLGIAGGAWIETASPNNLRSLTWRDRLAPDLSSVFFSARLQVEGEGLLHLQLIDPDGNTVWESRSHAPSGEMEMSGTLANPRLWWPRGQGRMDLYILRATLDGGTGPGQLLERQLGFRRVRLTMAPGQWNEPSAFPKSRSLPPVSLEINGRRVFGKGANMVGPDIFPGVVTAERWCRLVEQAAGANMNVLRVWGGAPVPPEVFYEACDKAGLMVIQDFPLSCNNYPDQPAYLEELEAAACRLMDRLAFHPCRILWNGGNELLNVWSGMTDQSHALRLLASLSWNRDPDTPFVPTLPVEGVGHGYYLFRDPRSGVECFELFQRARCTGYTEFGVPGAAPLAQIEAVVPEVERWPITPTAVWKLHSGLQAWDVEATSYLCLSTIEHYWGTPADLSAVVTKSHWLQAEGHKAIIEEARRQRPYCGWAVLWCLNEPWPTVANNCLISYPDQPKPALAEVAAAMRPTLVSARLPKFQWSPGESFSADLHILHDSPDRRPAVAVQVILSSAGWSLDLLDWKAPAGPPDTDLAGPTVRAILPETLGPNLILTLLASDPALSSRYCLATRQPTLTTEPHGAPRGLNV